MPYVSLCKINVGSSFISLWRLLHCESCGCYQKRRLCFLNGMTQSPPCRLGQLQEVCRSCTESGLQFFSCWRKQWAQVTSILLCTSHCFTFLCWTQSTAMSWPKFTVLLQDALLFAVLSSVIWLWLMLMLLSAPDVKWRIILLVKKWICDRFVCNLWALFMPELGNPLLSGNDKHLLDFLLQ